jgi:hypothetical protein
MLPANSISEGTTSSKHTQQEVEKMKGLTGLAAVVAAVVILTMSGWAVAAEPEKSVLPKVWDGKYHEASETGNLNRDAKTVKKESVSGDQTPKVEIGGRIYRIGIDTP